MPDSLLAVFSDVHANLEALKAVLADMDALGVHDRICLGDIVGYAANPAKCLRLVRDLGCPVLKGNHDEAVANDSGLERMTGAAQKGIEFARSKLSPKERSYLAGLPLILSEGDCQFVHASLNDPADWCYVMRETEAREHFQTQERPLSFCGHTHVPIIWHRSNTGNIRACRGDGRIDLPAGGKILINVGSVGQPRDLLPAACYVICDPKARWVEFRRVTYDIAKTQRKIVRAKLPHSVGERLTLGR